MANMLVDSPEQVAKWHADRATGVGASDTPKLLGLSPYGDALSVYLEKTEPLAADEPTDEQLAGLAFEDGIRRLFERRRGLECQMGRAARDPEYSWLRATPDYLLAADGRTPVQVKKVSHRLAHLWGEDGSENVPEAVCVQVQHEALVMGGERGFVAAFIGEHELRTYEIPANAAIQETIVGVAGDFWHNHVLPRVPPEPDFTSPHTVELLNRLHKPQPGIAVDLPEGLLTDLELYQAFGRDVKEAEAERASAKARILHAMKNAEVGRLGGWKVTRKVVQRKAYEVKAGEYCDLRVYGPKLQEVT